MVLEARDELRHTFDTDPVWRESVYFNFGVPDLNLGGWIYAWVTPNKAMRSGMLVSFYEGMLTDVDFPQAARDEPNHFLRGESGQSIYYYTHDTPELIDADFDDFQIAGLRLQRLDPLERYRLSYDDGVDTAFDIECNFLTPPWDYRDNVNPIPWYVADNRYHRGWQGKGRLRIAGQEHEVEFTGDSDHSWGRRDSDEFVKVNFKMWSAQVPGQIALSVVAMGPSGAEVPYGFVQHDGAIHAVTSMSESGEYDSHGTQQSIKLTLEDASGKTTTLSAQSFANFPMGQPGNYWGNEGPARYTIDDQVEGTGIVSYFWPPAIPRGNPPR